MVRSECSDRSDDLALVPTSAAVFAVLAPGNFSVCVAEPEPELTMITYSPPVEDTSQYYKSNVGYDTLIPFGVSMKPDQLNQAIPDGAFWDSSEVTGRRYEGFWLKHHVPESKANPWRFELCGPGTMKWAEEDGRVYKGQFKNGRMHGQGTFTWKNGEMYVGEFEDDKIQGHGTYTWPNGDKYVGQFRDGQKSGYGVFTTENGDRYRGYWNHDKKHGRGEFYQEDLGTLPGIWMNDLLFKDEELETIQREVEHELAKRAERPEGGKVPANYEEHGRALVRLRQFLNDCINDTGDLEHPYVL